MAREGQSRRMGMEGGGGGECIFGPPASLPLPSSSPEKASAEGKSLGDFPGFSFSFLPED